MSYAIEIRLASKNGWHTPTEARAYYGRYSRDGVTWHWWNTPDKITDADHDNICNYILGKAVRGEGSVNYVLSNTKITLLVNPDNVAWASQSGNPTTVSVELSPHLNAEGYKKAGWLFNELEGRYGKVLQHKKHSDWFPTACPGTIDVGRIAAEAAKWKSGAYNPPPPTPPVPVPPTSPKNIDWFLWKDPTAYVTNKQPTQLWDMTNVTSWSDPIPSAKSFNKGEIIVIVGWFHNVGLNRDYYITKYTFDNRKATGFSAADLDVYAPPVVTPPAPPEPVEEPEPGDETPVEPTDPPITPPTPDPTPPVPDPDAPPLWFVKLSKDFIAWLSGKIGNG